MRPEITPSPLCERLSSILSKLEAKVDALASGQLGRRNFLLLNTRLRVEAIGTDEGSAKVTGQVD